MPAHQRHSYSHQPSAIARPDIAIGLVNPSHPPVEPADLLDLQERTR
jgi:hypothetical protein